jgi:small subunit ribosomal protein S9
MSDAATTTEPTASPLPELTFSAPPATATAEPPPTEAAPVRRRGKIDKDGTAIGTGRRKTSVARVRLRVGNGKFEINGRPLTEFFRLERDRLMVEQPLRATEKLGSVDVWVHVEGGGTTGQAGAIVLGIARALEAMNPSLHAALSDNGFLTRDSRMVERKKYGFKKARRSFQFSKR